VHDFVLGIQRQNAVKAVLLAGIVLVLVSPIHLFQMGSNFNKGRLARFESLQDPFKDARFIRFQVINSYYAIGSGGFSAWASAKASKSTGICLNRTPTLLWRSLQKSSAFSVSFLCFLLGFHRHKRFLYCEKMR
jgi:cell division protein FtsW